nr:MAG TPA: hypothetical protein [Caudoviricetes sp.]
MYFILIRLVTYLDCSRIEINHVRQVTLLLTT